MMLNPSTFDRRLEGHRIRHLHGMFSTSTFDRRSAIASEHLFVNSLTAAVVWKTFSSPSTTQRLPLLDPNDLPHHSESYLQSLARTRMVVHSGEAICHILDGSGAVLTGIWNP